MIKNSQFNLLVLILLTICHGFGMAVKAERAIRREQNIDLDWKFFKGDVPEAFQPEFDDKMWQPVDLPHDWAIVDTFSPENPSGRAGGFASGGIGWYRKQIILDPQDSASLVSIEFDGVYMNSEVWINGHYLGIRPYGYISFNYDLTPYLDYNKANVIAVRVDNSKVPSARWYTGCGIYRHVWLVKTGKLHIARHGIFASTPAVNNDSALINIKVTIKNEFEKGKQLRVINELYSTDDELMARVVSAIGIQKNATTELTQEMTINNPKLWSPEFPVLYKLKTTINDSKNICDQLETSIGIRYFSFSSDTGFTLNGKNIKFKGVNNHADLGALGMAHNDRVLERRLEILKKMGCNAIRTAHYPHSRELVEKCDRMGFMVMDEAFDEWLESWPFGGIKKPEGKAKYGYHLYFNEWAETDLTELIRRDRNHPSVILWSVGNEIPDACFEIGNVRLKRLMDVVKKEDPTRPVTAGITHIHLANETGFASQLDVTGYNGGGGSAFMYEKDHETYPNRILIATEVPHSFQTRGIYRTHSWYRDRNTLGGVMDVPNLTEEEVFPDVPKYYSSSYDNAMVRINARDSWRRTRDFPYMCGEFRWTGFDYLGETMMGWPAKFWNFGIIDMCGFPKDTYYFYQSQWTEEPMVHILPHWNWEGKEGTEIPVVAYSNCETVELLLNGKSLGEKRMNGNLDLTWLVPYEPGLLTAKGRINDRVVFTKDVATASGPAKIELLPDRKVIAADRKDVVHIEVNLLDKDNNFVPVASNRVNFRVEGDARIIAVDNGDPLNEENYVSPSRKAFNGKILVILQSTEKAGQFTVFAESEGLEKAFTTIKTYKL